MIICYLLQLNPILVGYQIDTSLPFSLYLKHGFRSESEKPDRNRVKYLDFETKGAVNFDFSDTWKLRHNHL